MTASLPITNPNPKNGDTKVNIYGYTPWLALGIIAVLIFAICLAAHVVYTVLAIQRRRKASLEEEDAVMESQKVLKSSVVTFEILFSIGCLLEVLGYSFRTASNSDPYRLAFFILNYFLIVIAPVFFSAAIYLCLSILLVHETSSADYLPISGKTIIRTFVSADVITIILQIAGAALVGVSESALADDRTTSITPEQANDILLAGLAVQVFSFTIYLILLAIFLVRLISSRSPTRSNSIEKDHHTVKSSNILLAVLSISSVLVYIRTVFRLVESALGVESTAMRSQPLFAALETVPIIVTALLWTIAPIQYLLNRHKSIESA